MKKTRIALILIALSIAYLIGAITVRYQLPPYDLVKTFIVNKSMGDELDLDPELKQHFIDPIINPTKLRYPPIASRDELNNRINNMLIDVEKMTSAYDDIELISDTIEENIFICTFRYKDKIDTVFAYFIRSLDNSNIGINIIPGSGINQSTAMLQYTSINDNYQSNIDDIAKNYGDVYILVKPNEDFLAIHNGSKKIGSISFVNHLINNGGSYSSYYLLQSLVLSKFINQKYSKLYVTGLSQGGLAALINSIESKPNKAVIASGFSYFMKDPYRSSHNQIIIPGYRNDYNPDSVYQRIEESPTNFLFTWGLEEQGLYGKEALTKTTANFFQPLNNVRSIIHPEGHVYYEPAINEFLSTEK